MVILISRKSISVWKETEIAESVWVTLRGQHPGGCEPGRSSCWSAGFYAALLLVWI